MAAAATPKLHLVTNENVENARRTFVPVALEAMDAPPSPLSRTLVVLLCGLAAIAVAWSFFGKLDIVAVSSGKIVSHTRTKVVQPFEISTVAAILVHAGQHVHAGDPLIELDPVSADAERKRAQSDLLSARLDQLRLSTFSEGAPSAAFSEIPSADKLEVERAQAELTAQQAQAKAKLASLKQERAQRVTEREALKMALSKAQDILPLVTERSEIRHKLAEMQYGSKLQDLETQQQYVEAKAEVEIQRSKIASIDAAVEGLDQQMIAYEAELKKTALADLSRARRQADAANEALAKAEHRVALQTLRAPIDGTVQQLNVFTVGSVVTPAQRLLSVVPDDRQVEIEAILENKDIAFVSPGQPVELKIDAYPFTRYGLAKGRVVSVDRDAEPAPVRREDEGSERAADTLANIQGSENLVYTVHISVDPDTLMIDGRPAVLVPGMSIKAEILTGHRRIIDYLLAPLAEYRHDSLRER